MPEHDRLLAETAHAQLVAQLRRAYALPHPPARLDAAIRFAIDQRTRAVVAPTPAPAVVSLARQGRSARAAAWWQRAACILAAAALFCLIALVVRGNPGRGNPTRGIFVPGGPLRTATVSSPIVPALVQPTPDTGAGTLIRPTSTKVAMAPIIRPAELRGRDRTRESSRPAPTVVV
jgi:hypothetical protein